MLKLQKRFWSLSILFSHVKSKKLVTKKYEDKGTNIHNPNQFMTFHETFQNPLYNFFEWISKVIFPPWSSVFEACFQRPWILQKVKIAIDALAQNLK